MVKDREVLAPLYLKAKIEFRATNCVGSMRFASRELRRALMKRTVTVAGAALVSATILAAPANAISVMPPEVIIVFC